MKAPGGRAFPALLAFTVACRCGPVALYSGGRLEVALSQHPLVRMFLALEQKAAMSGDEDGPPSSLRAPWGSSSGQPLLFRACKSWSDVDQPALRRAHCYWPRCSATLGTPLAMWNPQWPAGGAAAEVALYGGGPCRMLLAKADAAFLWDSWARRRS